MMRIAYTSHDSLPSASTNTQQTIWTTTELARLGVELELVVPSVAADAGDADVVPSIARYYGLAAGEVPKTFRIKALGDRQLVGSIAKGSYDWRVAAVLRNAGAEPSADKLVWTRDPLALTSCARAGLPVVFETYRPDYATRPIFAPWRWLSLGSRHLRGIVTHSRLAADAYIGAGVPAERVLTAHNGFAPALMEPRLTRIEARSRLGLPAEGQMALYAGHTGPEKGVDVLIEMAAAAPAVQMVIVGAAPESADGIRLQEAARRRGVRNLLLRPRVPLSGVAAHLYAADCLVIPPTDEPLRRFRRTVLPMKVFMYLAAGRPILAPRLPDVAEVLTDGETARLVPPDDRGAAAAAFADLLADSALQQRLSGNALTASARYTWSARASRILAWLEALPLPSSTAASASSRR